jgi:hypothetical protein
MTAIKDINYVELVLALLFSFILVNLWYDFMTIFFFKYLELEANSAFVRFMIAFSMTVIFFSFVLLFNKIQSLSF